MLDIMIADDQELIRESLKIVIDRNADMQVTALAEDGEKLLALVEKHPPDVILMDVRMPRLDGVQATKIIRERFPNTHIIILTTFDDDEYVFAALKFGASGYLLKGVSITELAAAIRTVAAGGSILNPEVTAKVVKLFSKMAKTHQPAAENGAELLTHGEQRIARLVGRGLANKEIASELCLSEGTVRNSLSAALSKLQLRDRTQLAIWAVKNGLADSEDTP